MLKILVASYTDRDRLIEVLTERFQGTEDFGCAAAYLSRLYDIEAKTAIELLIARLSALKFEQQSALMEKISEILPLSL